MQENQNCPNNLEKENKISGFTLYNFKTYYEATAIKTV